MLLRAGPGWNWFHLEKQSLFFFFGLKQSLLSWKSRTDFRQRARHLRGAHGCYPHEGWKVRGSEPDRGTRSTNSQTARGMNTLKDL